MLYVRLMETMKQKTYSRHTKDQERGVKAYTTENYQITEEESKRKTKEQGITKQRENNKNARVNPYLSIDN